MRTDQQKGNPKQVRAVQDPSSPASEVEQQKTTLVQRDEELEKRVLKLESEVKELFCELNKFRPSIERSSDNTLQFADRLHEYSESEQLDLKTKKETLDNILTSLLT